MITVLRVIDRLNVGGPAIHAVLTARGLDRARFRTVLVIGSVEPGEADMGYLLDGAGVEHVEIPSLGRELRPLRDLATAWKLWRVMRRVRPDVVHTHKAKAGAIGRVVALLAGVPVRVHTFHGHVFHGYFSPSRTRAFLAIERALARVTTQLVALSDGLVDELSSRYHIAERERFAVVPLGFDLAPFATVVPQSHSPPRVGIVGRMVPVKDHATFVDAAAVLHARRPEIRFVFIGGGELESEVRARAEGCGILPQCEFLGWQRELAPLYAGLDVVALSSVNEGTPVALVEAMASGVPVVATRVGGVPDVLRDGARGELVPARDPGALADGIERALQPVARERAARIRADVIQEYGATRLCDNLEGLYSRLVPNAG